VHASRGYKEGKGKVHKCRYHGIAVWRTARDISGDRMSTQTPESDNEERPVKEEAEIYIMRLMWQPMSAVHHIGSKEKRRTSDGKIKLICASVYHGVRVDPDSLGLSRRLSSI
jgi:hypothetical protein